MSQLVEKLSAWLWHFLLGALRTYLVCRYLDFSMINSDGSIKLSWCRGELIPIKFIVQWMLSPSFSRLLKLSFLSFFLHSLLIFLQWIIFWFGLSLHFKDIKLCLFIMRIVFNFLTKNEREKNYYFDTKCMNDFSKIFTTL